LQLFHIRRTYRMPDKEDSGVDLDEEIQKSLRHIDIYRDTPIRLLVSVVLPSNQYYCK
uniref:RELB n=1 Tax=Anisakis simplex TaxID=6269 RepID=A0A0M3JPG7_ANISI